MKVFLLAFLVIFGAVKVGAEPIGFRITKIEHGSVFERLGLKNGDLITAANGTPLTNSAQLERLLINAGEDGPPRLTVQINRSGKPIELVYDFKPESKKQIESPCGKVAVVKYGKGEIEVILSHKGEKHNRGEVFKADQFDLALVSQAAIAALESKSLLFCAGLNRDNRLEYYLTR